MSSSRRPTRRTRPRTTRGPSRLYEETDRRTTQATAIVYFYLGNSYDNLYQSRARRAKPANDALMPEGGSRTTQLAVEKLDANNPTKARLQGARSQYPVAAYGPDKLNDPVKAEPVVQR